MSQFFQSGGQSIGVSASTKTQHKYQKKKKKGAEEGKEVEERLEREKEVSEVTAERERRRCTRISALVGWQLRIGWRGAGCCVPDSRAAQRQGRCSQPGQPSPWFSPSRQSTDNNENRHPASRDGGG